jgi:esterase/lipase
MKFTQKELIIKTHDSKDIYGTFSSAQKKSDSLIIFVHGFTGNKDEHIFFNGAKFLTEKGFNTYRFNLYSGDGKNIRHFHDTKISLHGKDITTVAKYFRKSYERIYVVGHSYGGTSLLFVDQSVVDGFIFWDASYIDPKKDGTENMKYNKDFGMYILDCGIEILVGKEFVEELRNFPNCAELIKKINIPVLFVTAGNRGNSKAGVKYFEFANNPKKLVNIEKADHNFNNWDDEKRLLEVTYNWLKK